MSNDNFLTALALARPKLADAVYDGIQHIAPFLPTKAVGWLHENYSFGEADRHKNYAASVCAQAEMTDSEYSHARGALNHLDSFILTKYTEATKSAVARVKALHAETSSRQIGEVGQNVIFNLGISLRVGVIMSFDPELRLYFVSYTEKAYGYALAVPVREENCRVADNHLPGSSGVLSCSEICSPW